MRILLPQSAEDAAVSGAALTARGHAILVIPLVVAERVANPKINLAAAQGFLVTGSEGARALADTVGVRTFPVFCESEQTAAERAEAERLAREQRERAEKEVREQRTREENARREQAAVERAEAERLEAECTAAARGG